MTTMPRRHAGRTTGVVVAVMAMVAGGCTAGRLAAGPPATGSPGRPATTTSIPSPVAAGERRPEAASLLIQATGCERFGAAVRAAALQAVGPYGFAGRQQMMAGDAGAPMAAEGRATPGPAPAAGTDFSATNVQEAGVDEPDTVKTDGRLVVTTAGGRLRVLDVTGPPRLVGALDLPGGAGDLFLVGDRALVLSGASGIAVPAKAGPGGGQPGTSTTVTVVDLKDPAAPVVARTHSLDGAYVDARLVGGVVRVVTRSQPSLAFPSNMTGQSPDTATAANAEVVRRADPAAFLPRGASCADAYVPAEPSGVGTIAVQSIDPAAPAPGPAVVVVADASTVYASASRLFVATNRFSPRPSSPQGGPSGPPEREAQGPSGPPEREAQGPAPGPAASRTAIHAFDITDPAKARYAGSGDVPGRLLNQFSLSEHEGVLRVATTLEATDLGGDRRLGAPPPVTPGGPAPAQTSRPAPTSSQSRVAILRPTGQEWVETGAVEGLGRGEQIKAVRFLGTTGYVVTFRQTDPLYVLDLGHVRSPKVAGELKITGYSAYLHPAGEHRLLGLGQEATEQGRALGPQLSLFDVGNPAAPSRLAGTVLAAGSSAADSEHHAFLFWPATGLAVVPITSYGGGGGDVGIRPGGSGPASTPFVGAVAFRVGDKSVAEAGRITHPGPTPIDRSLVVGNRLLTLSRVGLAVNDLRSLADGGFVPFR